MKNQYRLTLISVLAMALGSTPCMAISWQDKLANVAEDQVQRNVIAGTESGGLSLSSLSTMLNGGSTALSANTMANAAGVIEYCAKNKLTSLTNAGNIQSQLANKLNLNNPRNSAAKKDYTQGLSGLLNTSDGQQLDMNDLSHSELATKVKSKACDLVLKQGVHFLSK